MPRKKVKKEQALNEDHEILLDLKKSTEKILAEMNRNMDVFIKKANKSISNTEKAVVEVRVSILEHEKHLQDLSESNRNLEETVLNVLLAIRQNEYLQAWYPAQSGFEEMKVTGPHPARTKEKIHAS